MAYSSSPAERILHMLMDEHASLRAAAPPSRFRYRIQLPTSAISVGSGNPLRCRTSSDKGTRREKH